jgi:hypothetical protein
MAFREVSVGVTFRNFAALAKLKGWTAESLAQGVPRNKFTRTKYRLFRADSPWAPRLGCGDSVPARH